jgi:hypothetical protein
MMILEIRSEERGEEVKEEILNPRLVEYEYQRYLPRSANLNCPV